MINYDKYVTIAKILSNPNRMGILILLSEAKTNLCVNQIAETLKISQPVASQSLGYLSARGVIEGIKIGNTTCYIPLKTPYAQSVFSIIKTFKKSV